jgi:hypothetical protein
MKKQILSIGLVLVVLVTGNISHAAENKNTKELNPQEKIVKDFNAHFALTPAISVTDNGFIASSVVDGRQVSSAYNKRGNRIYTITRYASDNLDKHLIDLVKMNYDKYFISSIEKIEQPGFDAVYIAHLSNSNSIKTVRITRDGADLIQNFKKI